MHVIEMEFIAFSGSVTLQSTRTNAEKPWHTAAPISVIFLYLSLWFVLLWLLVYVNEKAEAATLLFILLDGPHAGTVLFTY